MTTVILAILLLGLVATGTAIQDICDQEAVGTRLAHPDDCAKFVVCGQQQVARTSICSLGLHFNRYTGECDFKASARCESSNALLSTSTECACSCCCDCCSTPNPTPTPDTPGPDTPTPPVTPGPGTPTPPVTPGPATPGPGTPGPGTPGPATPGPATPGPGTPGPGTPGPGTPTPGPDGCSNDLTVCKVEPNNSTHIYEGYCNKWITCQNGCSIILTCPNNLQWVQNGTDSYCDYPENISPKCPWPSAPPETGPSGISCTNQGKCAGAKEGYMYVNPDNSNLYNVCQCECPIAMKCPGGLVFNTELNVCDWPPLN